MQHVSLKNLFSAVPAIARLSRKAFCLLTTAFLLGVSLCATTAAGEGEQPTEHVFRLQYVESGFYLPVPPVENREVRFTKEPEFARRRVVRGAFQVGPDEADLLGWVWDSSAKKLYLDLNRNLDLTDDPSGVYESTEDDFFFGAAYFENLKVTVKRDDCDVPYAIEVDFFTPTGGATVKSGWVGEIALTGKKWWVGIADNMDGVIGGGDTFFLKDASKAEEPSTEKARPPSSFAMGDFLPYFDQGEMPDIGSSPVVMDVLPGVGSGEPSGVLALQRLSFDDTTYDLAFTFEPGETQAELVGKLTASDVPTGRVNIEGKSIERLILERYGTDSMSVVILDSPDDSIVIPAGEYQGRSVFLAAGKSTLFHATKEEKLLVAEDTPATLKAGAPLDHGVDIVRRGNTLQLSYKLLGTGGEKYEDLGFDFARQPKYAVYSGDKKIGSGTFEYG